MKLLYAARFALFAFLLAAGTTLIQLSKGLAVAGVQFRRLGWIVENDTLWSQGGWLWMVAIFAWMWLLVSLAWAYLPAHRVQSMLQSGLMIIAALLSIIGVIVWWVTLPLIAMQEGGGNQLAFVDALVLGLLGAAFLMGGVVTAWIGYDLLMQRLFPIVWNILPIAAGGFAALSPLLFPSYWHLLVSLSCWLAWCGYLATRPQMPNAFSEWK